MIEPSDPSELLLGTYPSRCAEWRERIRIRLQSRNQGKETEVLLQIDEFENRLKNAVPEDVFGTSGRPSLLRMASTLDAKVRELTDAYLQMEDLVDNGLYRIRARNANYGIWNGKKKEFEIFRKKFEEEFLDSELHWDADPHHGTAKPDALIEVPPLFEDASTRFAYLKGWCERLQEGVPTMSSPESLSSVSSETIPEAVEVPPSVDPPSAEVSASEEEPPSEPVPETEVSQVETPKADPLPLELRRGGLLLTEYREKEGLTQAQLAKRLYVYQTLIHWWEKGMKSPEPKKAAFIEKVTGIPTASWDLQRMARRKPGRPPKVKTEEIPVEVEKKKRGRPPKAKVETTPVSPNPESDKKADKKAHPKADKKANPKTRKKTRRILWEAQIRGKKSKITTRLIVGPPDMKFVLLALWEEPLQGTLISLRQSDPEFFVSVLDLP